jgi:hypothetical protein
MPGVRNRPDAHRHPCARADRRGRTLGGVELAVELREAGAIGAAVEAVLLRPGAPALEPGQAFQGVL